MGKQIKGIPVREKIEKDIDKDIFLLAKNKIVPKIATIRVGADSGQIFYEKAIMKRAAAYKMKSENLVFEEGILQDELESKIIELNEDSSVHGILVLMPLPKYLDQDRISNLIKPDKDIDAITDVSYANLISGKDKDKAFFACTAEACMEILKLGGYEVRGKKVTIFGRSLRVGKPLALMMMNENATITVCHTRTKEEDAISASKNADIVILATGQTGAYDRKYFSDGQVVVDVGTGRGRDGKIAGDFNAEDVLESGLDVKYTPVPGGVGAVTTTILMRHVIKAALNNL